MSISEIAQRANGSVMLIDGTSGDGKTDYQGTGFIVAANGIVVTNYHVIAHDATAVAKLPNGAYFPVSGVLEGDSKRDLAILKLNAAGLRPLTLGNSSNVQVGQQVVAIGNPEALESSVSDGIISGLRDDPDLGERFLQITAPISPGSSGGPLFDMRGLVIGITTMYVKGGENLNFAIPVNAVKQMLSRVPARVRPLPGETSVHLAPAAQRSSSPSNSQNATQYLKGYFQGWKDATRSGYSITRPSGKPALYVSGTISQNDPVGSTFVYDLRADIAGSPLYTLVASPSDADFEIDVVTVDVSGQIETAGAVVLTCGGSQNQTCLSGLEVDSYGFAAGSDAVGAEAQNMLAEIDQAVTAAPVRRQ